MTPLFAPPAPTFAPTSTGAFFPVRRIFCVGRNYAAHAREMGRDPDREPPFFFTAWAETVVLDGATLPYPPRTEDFHYEAELVVALGAGGRDIPIERALGTVWGYAAGLDMTRRDLQLQARAQGRPWDLGKNVEHSSPLGLIQQAESGFSPDAGRIWLTVNGELRQEADLGDMIWPVADLISYLSSYYRLEPGDLIYTGTPAGVGAVNIGDRIEMGIDGLPGLSVTIGAPAA